MTNTETAFCNLCHKGHDLSECEHHSCTGDNCYCIGGDENLDAEQTFEDAWEAFCLNRVAPLGGD